MIKPVPVFSVSLTHTEFQRFPSWKKKFNIMCCWLVQLKRFELLFTLSKLHLFVGKKLLSLILLNFNRNIRFHKSTVLKFNLKTEWRGLFISYFHWRNTWMFSKNLYCWKASLWCTPIHCISKRTYFQKFKAMYGFIKETKDIHCKVPRA